jgi:hypothetical protein
MNVRPFVYHLAEAKDWPSIQQHGLLSTRTFLDRIGTDGSSRAAVVVAPVASDYTCCERNSSRFYHLETRCLSL